MNAEIARLSRARGCGHHPAKGIAQPVEVPAPAAVGSGEDGLRVEDSDDRAVPLYT